MGKISRFLLALVAASAMVGEAGAWARGTGVRVSAKRQVAHKSRKSEKAEKPSEKAPKASKRESKPQPPM